MTAPFPELSPASNAALFALQIDKVPRTGTALIAENYELEHVASQLDITANWQPLAFRHVLSPRQYFRSWRQKGDRAIDYSALKAIPSTSVGGDSRPDDPRRRFFDAK
jgi:hypothetical protein